MTTKLQKFMQSFKDRSPLHQAILDVGRLGPAPTVQSTEEIWGQARDKVAEMLVGDADDLAPLVEMLTDEQIDAITDKEDENEVVKVLTFEQAARLAFTHLTEFNEYYDEQLEYTRRQLEKREAKVAKLKKKIKA